MVAQALRIVVQPLQLIPVHIACLDELAERFVIHVQRQLASIRVLDQILDTHDSLPCPGELPSTLHPAGSYQQS
ncbi:Uncharacterised protein [Mycobacteroides abscessus subsp. abscessus]|nr:Uncharacterised protein [Mycobacteroides abscessus subsp. abscessus]